MIYEIVENSRKWIYYCLWYIFILIKQYIDRKKIYFIIQTFIYFKDFISWILCIDIDKYILCYYIKWIISVICNIDIIIYIQCMKIIIIKLSF